MMFQINISCRGWSMLMFISKAPCWYLRNLQGWPYNMVPWRQYLIRTKSQMYAGRTRSEERRVGKEGRCWRWPGHETTQEYTRHGSTGEGIMKRIVCKHCVQVVINNES